MSDRAQDEAVAGRVNPNANQAPARPFPAPEGSLFGIQAAALIDAPTLSMISPMSFSLTISGGVVRSCRRPDGS